MALAPHKIYAEYCDSLGMQQFYEAIKQPWVVKAALMPDAHGAGRVFSRKDAKDTLSLDAFAEQMNGITAKVGRSTLDESPDAYKNIFDVMRMQKDLVDVVHHLKPIINVKA